MTDVDAPAEKQVRVPLTPKDKLRRLGIGLFVAACLAIIAAGAWRAKEVDANGDTIVNGVDPNTVEISGDPELVAEQPPGVAGGGPSEEEIVEQTMPAANAEILQQEQIGIDLGDRFNAVSLAINGTVLPESELNRRPELNQVFFSPGEGRTFETLPAGRVCATATVERISDPGDVVRSVEWCFEVT